MSGAESLLLCLAALYLAECVVIVRGEEVLFERVGGRWRERCGGLQLDGIHVRLVFTHPLSFGATHLIARRDAPLGGQPELAALRARLRTAADVLAALRADGAILASLVFLLAPAIVLLTGLSRAWLPLLVAGVVLVGCVIADFRRAHVALSDAREGLWSAVIPLLVSPAAAMRAHHQFARALAGAYHPLVVATALCDADEVHRLAAAELRQRGGDPALLQLLASDGRASTDLCGEPSDRDPWARSYCPRCLAQYSRESGACADCDGEPLVHFRAPAVPA